MHLYSLTLQGSGAISHSIVGNFSGTKNQEIIVARGKTLELLVPDEKLLEKENTVKFHSILSVDVFGLIRSIVPFRLTGGSKDYIIVGSDSGRIVILEYNPAKNVFDKVHQETFGKSGCRRIVAGQYLAVDPKGRAVMIAAVEKQKLVYILNRDAAARLTISSPLDAHKAHTLVYSIVGVDVGFENPIFAVLEVDYSKADQENDSDLSAITKNLTYYELDLGLNHVVRKWSESVNRTANFLIAVPGGSDGPGGVLICADNYIYYKNQGHPERSAPIPRRSGTLPEQTIQIVASTILRQKKDVFFFIVQNEFGDLYKVSLVYEEDVVEEVRVSYFDSIPVANSLSMLKRGLLFAASESSNHYLYQFIQLGDDDEPEQPSADGFVYFKPRGLKNLQVADEFDSLSPITSFEIRDLTGEVTPQIYTLCGRGRRSTLRILRHGLAVTQIAATALAEHANGIWTVKKAITDESDAYIIVSFASSTLVLAIGETVREIPESESGFFGSSSTLAACLMGEDSLVQVHTNGIRHIRADRRINEWKAPGKKTIQKAAVNNKQVVVALSGGELFYFELDISGQLVEIAKKDLNLEVSCLDLAPIPEGRLRARFLAIADTDNNVRVLSLDPDDCLQSLSLQQLPSAAESIVIVEMRGVGNVPSLFLNIGLKDGVFLRTLLNSISGELTDTRRRFLGTRPVRLVKVKQQRSNAVIALSSRSWLCYDYHSKYHMTPLSCFPLEYASGFTSPIIVDAEGIIGISGNSLRIIALEKLGRTFNAQNIPLRYTPRALSVHPQSHSLIIVESDHNSYSALDNTPGTATSSSSQPSNSSIKQEKEDSSMEVEDGTSAQNGEEVGEALTVESTSVRPGPAKWASCIRLFHPANGSMLDVVELDGNEAAFTTTPVTFRDHEGELFIAVGTAADLKLTPRKCSSGFIHIYRLVENSSKLQLLHKTPVENVPGALAPFQGRLLAGVGNLLRIYDLGKRKLLRKCETKLLPNFVKTIHTMGDRIIVGDISESFHYLKYKKTENQFYIFADDTAPRWVTSSTLLDYDTVAGGDKFGNVFICRLPTELSDEIDDDPTGAKLKLSQGILNGAPHKCEEIIQFHVGEVVTGITKASLLPGGSQCLLYGTIMGSIGALFPFVSREDVDFFSHLEMHLRQEKPPLCGRDHLQFRSYYFPVRDVIDGDLCEQYALLDPAKQKSIAEELDRTPSEVLKKLEDIRNMIL